MNIEDTSIHNNAFNSGMNNQLIDGLVDIYALSCILGYSNIKYVRTWCRKKDIKLVVLGRKTYVQSNQLEQYIQMQVGPNTMPVNKTSTTAQKSDDGPIRENKKKHKV